MPLITGPLIIAMFSEENDSILRRKWIYMAWRKKFIQLMFNLQSYVKDKIIDTFGPTPNLVELIICCAISE